MSARGLHWASINEISFVAGMRLLFWICRLFGRWPFRVVLYPVLAWYVLTKPLPRRASREYLRRVSAYAGVKLPGVMRHFASFGESILDKMLLWGGLFKLDQVTLHGGDLITDAVAAGKGGLMICAHLGNLELCRVLSRQRRDIKLTVLVHTKHAQAFNDMLGRLNPESQLNLMQVTEMSPATAMLLAERVARGEFVVIAGDRVPVSHNPRVAVADFIGAPAAFPVGPYVLASVLQCPVFLLFSIRRGDKSEVHFERFRDEVRIPRQHRDDALNALAADYARRLEHYTLRAPLQWFNYYDFWHLPQLDKTDAPR
ncbi:putative LPLAT superfamily acyltransferase [Duganella sp. SG902]|uniref:LpxL/LpxP family acyltransferase n=1 Tax=Duganella sp. SG902 TaxID=2587016 RepID=UPI00159D4E36|nr:acyltransferase [Duganella sp. SG902]NVM77852.1 putative LPLAT superfamily acyltransferase [Duganella sp. SG902]